MKSKDRDLKQIRDMMSLALEGEGNYVCHYDIPEETPMGFDSHFTICGEEESPVYLVLIQKINI